ncbi:hypothetical protein A3D78_01905 [Candidatus Gottesmanbacteria bacterium RIFCSPHIGHO2_02_FULL_39_14]|uniref:DUF3048 domain-containing protein n=2 Tax=Candidatus Gottesmaniibacteriota TaxID=1752720 RepID=A0A1F6A1K3_9BACT|nr:MAG: hypothetical protein A2153_03170 [Candidatus Gottesmanbacteria bacterium RBG_16_38_7b]OGG18550.1 MAG: hypothetical protein A3D78_01905 [Candidatus Gottesmanbacteria bacterium RIFCSPHIGHO2_02_FULL_39_14]
MKKLNLIQIFFSVALYFISTGISFAAFNLTSVGEDSITSPVVNISPSTKAQFKVDPSVPRDQVCPLNGVKYTKQESDIYQTRRPLAVMVENSEDSRPQSGISRADIVYEAIAEGWITRLMGIFYCNTPMENIVFAPVRSARTYFVDWVSEYDALYNHVGGAGRCNDDTVDNRAKALCQIDRYGIKDLDQFGIGFPDCYRNPDRLSHPVATEHTMVCFSDNLYKIAEKRDWTNVDDKGIPWDKSFEPWQFKDDPPVDVRGTVNSVKLVFAQGYDKYDALWQYDKETNVYKRQTGGQPHLDLENKEQVTAKNIIVQLSKITGPVDEHGHILYTTIGNGKAIIFQDGKVIVGSWSKKSRLGRTKFYDNVGHEIDMTRGPIWIEIVDSEQKVTY